MERDLIHGHGHAALRRGRTQARGAVYFVTWVEAGRRGSLATADQWQAHRADWSQLEQDTGTVLRALVVMPDHLHALLRLEGALSLSQQVARLKAAWKRRRPEPLWERGFYEHRMRPDEPTGPVVSYILRNPEAAGLSAEDKPWPYTYLRPTDHLPQGYDHPEPPWLHHTEPHAPA